MNEGLKHRIIGILVLIALVVVFMPMLFDLDKRVVDTQSQIPSSPDIAPVNIAEPVRPQGIVEPQPDTEIFQPDETTAITEDALKEKAEPALGQEGLPDSWVLQVGSFQEKETAQNLVSTLQEQGYKAYTQAYTSKGKALHRVFVGPKMSKSHLLKEKAAIDKKYGVNSLILEFTP